jgi:hypothetical protein
MAQRYEKLVQEDLNVGTETVWVTAPGGGQIRATQVGLHSVARGQVSYEAAWTPGAIAAGSKASTTVSVPDAATGDLVMASHDKMGTSDLRISGHVSAAGVAKVVIHNPTSASITVAAGTVAVLVFPAIGTSSGPTTGSVSGTIYLDDALPGNVVDAATVEITLQSLTDTSTIFGTYSFATVTPGSVTVDASKLGYIPGSNTGTVVAGSNTVIDVVIYSPV